MTSNNLSLTLGSFSFLYRLTNWDLVSDDDDDGDGDGDNIIIT